MAIAAGASRVVLIGYDMKYAVNGKTHWHEGHPVKVPDGYYRNVYTRMFETLKTDVEILNASLDTALTCFVRCDLESILPDP